MRRPSRRAFAAGADQTGSAAFRENPVSLRALNPRERSFPGAAAGRTSSGESESRRRCMRAAGAIFPRFTDVGQVV